MSGWENIFVISFLGVIGKSYRISWLHSTEAQASKSRIVQRKSPSPQSPNVRWKGQLLGKTEPASLSLSMSRASSLIRYSHPRFSILYWHKMCTNTCPCTSGFASFQSTSILPMNFSGKADPMSTFYWEPQTVNTKSFIRHDLRQGALWLST